MAVRHFTRASSDYIHFQPIGAMPTMGPATAAILTKKSSNTSDFEYYMVASNNADPDNWQWYIGGGGDNKPSVWLGTAELKAPFTVTAAEGWCMVAVTKAAGTNAPRHHKCVLSTGAWTHADSASTGPGAGSMFTRNTIGASTDHSGGFYDGNIAALAVWNTVLADAALEAIAPVHYTDMDTLVAGWLAAAGGPSAMWRLDQASTATAVDDLTLGGSNQFALGGTSVVTGDDPPFPAASTASLDCDPSPAVFSVVELT